MRCLIRDDFDNVEPAQVRPLFGKSSQLSVIRRSPNKLRSRAMSIQFAGSTSSDDRRRRRLVVNADDPGADETMGGEGLSAGGVASELVASAAAAPWVPVYEWRVWTYAALIGLVLSGASFALAMPLAFRPELTPLTQHLLQGERPVLAALIQTTFCFLAAQLAILISWYRAQCKLDFRGYYRVWPWTALVFAIAAFSSATNAHGLLGQILERSGLLSWRANVVVWLLPAAIAALPLVVLVDRDVRRSRSSLFTLRVGWVLALVMACLELFAVELQILPWTAAARVILPMFVIATMFVGLWLHARVVAYICPDPPEAQQTTAFAQLMAGWRWIAARAVWRRRAGEATADSEAKPKRGRRKATTEEEDDAAPKRKRKAPVRRAAKPRTRKVAEVEEEEVEDDQESSYADESVDSSDAYDSDSAATEVESNEWDREEQETAPPVSQSSRSYRDSNSQPSPALYPASKTPASTTRDEPEQSASESDDDDADDAILRRDTGMSAEQMKGLSKRQKRELRKQARDQQRNQRR